MVLCNFCVVAEVIQIKQATLACPDPYNCAISIMKLGTVGVGGSTGAPASWASLLHLHFQRFGWSQAFPWYKVKRPLYPSFVLLKAVIGAWILHIIYAYVQFRTSGIPWLVTISCHSSCCDVAQFISLKPRNVLASFGWIIRFGSVMAIDCTNKPNQKVQCSSDIAEMYLGNGLGVGCFPRVSDTPRWFQLPLYQCLCHPLSFCCSIFVWKRCFDACEIIRFGVFCLCFVVLRKSQNDLTL